MDEHFLNEFGNLNVVRKRETFGLVTEFNIIEPKEVKENRKDRTWQTAAIRRHFFQKRIKQIKRKLSVALSPAYRQLVLRERVRSYESSVVQDIRL
jgi:hypothetical protein